MKEAKHLARIAGAVEAMGDSPAPRNTGNAGARKQKLPFMANLILLFGSSAQKSARAVAARRSFPIVAFVGANGGGKSLAAVATTLPTIAGIKWTCANPAHLHTAQGVTSGYRKILSTVKILDPLTGEISPHYVPFVDFQQLIDAEHCDVIMDEVTGVASSRESGRMDARVANKLVQLRRCDVVLRWTAPNWARSDKIIREVTQAVVECSGYFPGHPVTPSGEMSSGGLWAPKRVFRFRCFDTAEFEEWSAGKRDKLDPVSSEWFKGVGSAAFAAYDTLDAVNAVAGMTPEDTCTVCEGRITRHICKGHTPKKKEPVAAPAADLPFPDYEPAPEHDTDDVTAKAPLTPVMG